jgi:hypothetical protein
MVARWSSGASTLNLALHHGWFGSEAIGYLRRFGTPMPNSDNISEPHTLIAQRIEHLTTDQKATGSNPVKGTMSGRYMIVECILGYSLTGFMDQESDR